MITDEAKTSEYYVDSFIKKDLTRNRDMCRL